MSWSRFWRRRYWDEERRHELESYIEIETDDNIARGMPAEAALAAARRKLGNATVVRQEIYLINSLGLEHVFKDVRFGLRLLRRNPFFTTMAILALALGIGTSTSVFSVLNAVLLKPLPYRDAERIVIPLRLAPPGLNVGHNALPWSSIDFQLMAREVTSIEDLSAFYADSFSPSGQRDHQFLHGLRASAGFFDALGVQPAIGRTFTAEEDQPAHEHEVVIGDGLWRDRFGASKAILGESIELNGASYTVIGVMPPWFVFPRSEEMPGSVTFPHETQLWVPLTLTAAPGQPDQSSDFPTVIGRLRPRHTIAQAQAELNVFARHREEVYGSKGKDRFNSRLVSLERQVAGDVRRPLLLTLGAVGVVLLLACSSVASLMLARSQSRQREFSLRSALGAAPARLLRQLLIESLILALAGGLLGVGIAEGFLRLAIAFGSSNIPRLREAAIDPAVLTFALATSVLTGLLSGLAPALGGRRPGLLSSLKGGVAPRLEAIHLWGWDE